MHLINPDKAGMRHHGNQVTLALKRCILIQGNL